MANCFIIDFCSIFVDYINMAKGSRAKPERTVRQTARKQSSAVPSISPLPCVMKGATVGAIKAKANESSK